MKHIASFSTGLSSAVMVERLLARYGKDAVTVVVMDTLIEDDDNYRFAADCGRRWGVDFVWLREGRDPYQVNADHNVIPNQKAAYCTFDLKITPFKKYLASLKDALNREWMDNGGLERGEWSPSLTVHIGFDYSEVHRCAATDKNYNALGYAVDYPLLWKPLEHRPYAQVVRQDWGIEPPRMYGMGYTHANCGGRCVKQGKGDWLRTLINFPERYAEAEAWEAKMRENPTNAAYALLRDQSDGEVRPMTLRQLREEYEAGQSAPLFTLDRASACVVCGVGV